MQILMILLLGIMLLPHPASAWFIDDFILPQISVNSTAETGQEESASDESSAEPATSETAGAEAVSIETGTEPDAVELEAATAAAPSATPEAELEATGQKIADGLNETTEAEAVVAESAAVPAAGTAPPDIALSTIAPDISPPETGQDESASDESSAEPTTSETAEAEAVSIETGTEPDAVELEAATAATPSATPEAEFEATGQKIADGLNETTEAEAVVAESATVPAAGTAPPDIALSTISPGISPPETGQDESASDESSAEPTTSETAEAEAVSIETGTEPDAVELEAATAATPSVTPEAELEVTEQNVVDALNETTETEAVVAESAAVPAAATAPPDIALPTIAPDISPPETGQDESASDESSAEPATSETAEAEAVSIETGTEPDAVELPAVKIGTSADLLPSSIAGSELSQGLNQQSRLPENNFYEDPITGMPFIFVEGGCFMMGSLDCGPFSECSSDEEPSHEVCLDDYWLGAREVSQTEWQQVMGNNPAQFPGRDRPMEHVSWNDVQAFLFKLNNLEDSRYRLPTEAEWEYAARSGSKAENWAGTDSMTSLGEYAWYAGNSGELTHPGGQKRPNSLGFYDMSGNVWEWCLDGYSSSYYAKSPRDNPQGMEDSSYRVQRGGSWLDTPQDLRTARRGWSRPDYRTNFIGFRLMLPAN